MSETPPIPKDPRHQRFADRLLAGDSIVDAYLAAGFKCERTSAMHAGTRLKKRADVVAYMAAIQEKAADDSCLNVLEIRRFLARIVRTPIMAIRPDDEDRKDGDLIKKIKRKYRTDDADDETEHCFEELEKLDPLKAIEIDLKLSGQDPELNHLKLIADAITSLGEGPIPSDQMPE